MNLNKVLTLSIQPLEKHDGNLYKAHALLSLYQLKPQSLCLSLEWNVSRFLGHSSLGGSPTNTPSKLPYKAQSVHSHTLLYYVQIETYRSNVHTSPKVALFLFLQLSELFLLEPSCLLLSWVNVPPPLSILNRWFIFIEFSTIIYLLIFPWYHQAEHTNSPIAFPCLAVP